MARFSGFFSIIYLLALCPALAMTNTAMNALMLGIATLLITAGTYISMNRLRKKIPDTLLSLGYIIVLASWISAGQILLMTFWPQEARYLGIYIPLIFITSWILGLSDSPTIFHLFQKAIGFAMALISVGAIRELLGHGTLFGLVIFPDYYPMLVMLLPPGAFWVIGALLIFHSSPEPLIHE